MIYSTLLARGYFANGTHTVYTAPSGVTVVLRSIQVATFSSAVNDGYIGVSGQALFAGWHNQPTLLPLNFDLRAVLDAADVVELVNTTSDSLISISGYVLS